MLALAVLLQGCTDSTDPSRGATVYGLDNPDALVLRVQVLSEVSTDLYNSDGCPQPDDGSQCIQMYFWHKYKARVLGVVRGKWEGRLIQFAKYQHSRYLDRLVADCYVVLVRADPQVEQRLGVPYISEDIVLRKLDADRDRTRTIEHGT
jgi:hypothetical protein